jgi:predicted nucleic acid-binding protein
LIVVSDTSPILNLARIGRLELLPSLYREVLIPPAVQAELIANLQDAQVVANAQSWLTVLSPNDRERVLALSIALDIGEAEAIALAIERGADLLPVDERRGRRIAAAAGLTVMGLLGVVAKAKQAGLITAAKPVIDELIEVARFWIAPGLYKEVLARLGEPA